MESNTPSLPTIFILYSGAVTETSSRIIVWPTTVPVRTSLLLAGRSRVKDQSPILPSKLYSGLGRAQTARNIIFGMRDLWNTRWRRDLVFSSLVGKDAANSAVFHHEEPLLISVDHVLQVVEI